MSMARLWRLAAILAVLLSRRHVDWGGSTLMSSSTNRGGSAGQIWLGRTYQLKSHLLYSPRAIKDFKMATPRNMLPSFASLCLLFMFYLTVHSSPVWLSRDATSSAHLGSELVPRAEEASFGHGIELRVLPLGASITWGQDSSDGNGYREALQQKMIAAKNNVTFIGQLQHGNMKDNNNEGWRGYVIDQVSAKASNVIPEQPNLIVIHVGTDDMICDLELANAPTRLGNLIDKLLNSIPDTVVLVSTLIPNRNETIERRIEAFNSQVPGVVSQRAAEGKKVYLADMHNGTITTADINAKDGTHPTDEGYQKMADIWWGAVEAIGAKGWFHSPNKATS
ncbi:MAG: hypothetical protein M1818_003749 [Claussenomyces sp. TS43310]|nr:MAG: hypothetical protein M1818_003749 [Claussenomyces sp. TS43310]